jgi:hypothetical protein
MEGKFVSLSDIAPGYFEWHCIDRDRFSKLAEHGYTNILAIWLGYHLGPSDFTVEYLKDYMQDNWTQLITHGSLNGQEMRLHQVATRNTIDAMMAKLILSGL